MKIVAVGDIMPGGVLAGVNEGYVSQEVRDLLSSADIRVGTLETAIGNEPTFYDEKMRRKADVIYAKDADLIKLKDLHIDIVSLANNHFFDLGPEGAVHTIELLDSMGIKHIGAGRNLEEASKPVVVNHEGKTIAFLGFCDWREDNVGWCPIATETQPGVCPMYDDYVIELVKNCKSQYDFVVVMPHWGKEYTPYPLLSQYRLSNKMLVAGACLVLGGHTHSIQPVIPFKQGVIAYSMGNFLFPDRFLNSPRSTWYPKENIVISDYPVTFEYPYAVAVPTLKIWKPIARKGLIVCIDLINTHYRVKTYETYFDNNQFLRIIGVGNKKGIMSFIFKMRLYPLYCAMKRVYSVIRMTIKRK